MAGCHWTADLIPPSFVAFRTVVVLLMLWMTALSIQRKASEFEWYFVYLTNWSQWLGLVTVTTRLTSTIMVQYNLTPNFLHHRLQSLSPSLRRLYTTQSILSRAAVPTMTAVALNYWLFVYGPSSTHELWKDINRIQLHGVNCLLMWTDHVLSAERYFYSSTIWSVAFCTLYVVWNIIFEFTIKENENGEPYIYSATDWSEDWKTPLILYFVSMMVVTGLSCLATFLKNLILVKQRRVFKEAMKKQTESEMTPSQWSSTEDFQKGIHAQSDTVDVVMEQQAGAL